MQVVLVQHYTVQVITQPVNGGGVSFIVSILSLVIWFGVGGLWMKRTWLVVNAN